MRYCWEFTDKYVKTLPPWTRGFAAWRFEKLREWDLTTVNNVDRYVANSRNVADRISRYYGKEASVCYPPIENHLFEAENRTGEKKDYFLSFGAVTPYKNIGLLVDAFADLDEKLIVIGVGGEKDKLEKRATSNVVFKGTLPWSKIHKYIREARALMFPGEEDFGMIPLEVMAHGVPVIAFGKGGALETVVDNPDDASKSTGVFFRESTKESLKAALERFERIENEFDSEWISDHARKFGEDHFLRNISSEILAALNAPRGARNDSRKPI